jgi:GNAT superfamily N-acetyltransferase
MISPVTIFSAYSRERKLVTPPGYRIDCLDGLTRLTPTAPDLEGVVMFTELSARDVDKAITGQIQYFGSLSLSFEWKVYSLDSPADLSQRLANRGFVAGDMEALMIYQLDACPDVRPVPSVRIERVSSECGIEQIVEVQEAVWGRAFPWLKQSLSTSLDRTAVFCAYAGDAPIGTGWIDFPERSCFAELHGGAVLPGERGRGVYSALFQARVHEAAARGIRFVTVDAAPMSRPILLRKGFTHVCDTIPFRRNGHLKLREKANFSHNIKFVASSAVSSLRYLR